MVQQQELMKFMTMLGGALVCLAGCASDNSNLMRARTDSICTLVNEEHAADGKRVRVQVIFRTDGVENSILEDVSCPGVVVEPRSNDASSENESDLDESGMKKFEKLLYGGTLDGSSYRVMKLDVSGTFRWRAETRPKGALEMEKFWDIELLEPAKSPQVVRP